MGCTLQRFLHVFADPFADATKDDAGGGAHGENFIHIRIQQRNGRKTLTTVQGISSQYDLKKIVRACKKVCSFHWMVSRS